jgi:arabinose-5-phosphate isomerase
VIISTEIIETAINTIKIEHQAIKRLIDSIDQEFVSIVELIYKAKGRLVITGIGKSAIIGQKIVATLNSTGTAALFMHAADAIHGDLGMIREGDVLLCISKSGETSEVKALVPLIRQLNAPLVAMVSRRDSFLGKNADFILHTPLDKEADPNNLAPTTSTTLQIVMGDALATALLKTKGFSPRDFAQVHPGGSLGKQLYLKVSDLYPNNEKPMVQEDANIREVILEITSKRLGCAVVTGKDHSIKGIITDGDLRRMLEQNEDVTHLKASDIMSTSPKQLDSDTLAVKAMEIMRSNSISQLIVVKDDKYEGIVHIHDLLKEGII